MTSIIIVSMILGFPFSLFWWLLLPNVTVSIVQLHSLNLWFPSSSVPSFDLPLSHSRISKSYSSYPPSLLKILITGGIFTHKHWVVIHCTKYKIWQLLLKFPGLVCVDFLRSPESYKSFLFQVFYFYFFFIHLQDLSSLIPAQRDSERLVINFRRFIR